MNVNVYLFFNGNCEEALKFYRDATDGTIESLVRYGDTPNSKDHEGWRAKIMHGVLQINGSMIMCSDAPEHKSVTMGNNFSISLNYKDEARLRQEFAAFTDGGVVTMPLQDTFWGAIFGMCTDKFGVNWMFNFDRPVKK